MSSADAAHEYHERTKHTHESVWAGGHVLDWANQPLPFKHYPSLAPARLPTDLPESAPSAIAALSGRAPDAAAGLDLAGLARLLFFSAGTNRPEGGGAEPLLRRAAPSAGALYPIETYVVCGDLGGLAAGAYHFGPVEFALRRLRSGDHRPVLAAAAADPALAACPAALVLTGIPWRTTWKYRERGYRHLFWDSGAILANLLALAEAAALPARVLVGFVDRAVASLVGVRAPEELPLAIVPLGDPGEEAPVPGAPLEPLALPVRPLSPHPQDYPFIAETHAGGNLADAEEVAAWRAGAPAGGNAPPVAAPPAPGAESLEAVILRRDSTRLFQWGTIPGEALAWPMGVAARRVPFDAAASGSLLAHLVSVHDVDGLAPGTYRWEDDGLVPAGSGGSGGSRALSAELCLAQELGGDSAYTAFHCCRLGPVLAALGARGYRAAQLEAGIASGRLQLATRALGLGGTGLTFFDDEVSRAFATDAAPMTATAVGVPAYRHEPGRRPADMPRLRVADGPR